MEEIKDVQKIALNVLKYVDKICRENNIKYSLAGGTLLGAIRHKGFIPWDDDIDIMIPRDDYERFLKIMDEDAKTNKKYKCLHFGEDFPNYFYPFAKVVDLSTHLIEGNYKTNEQMGIFVDVFPIDGINNKKADKIIKKMLLYRRIGNHAAMKRLSFTKNTTFFKKIGKILIYPYAKLFGYKYWGKKIEKFVRQYNFNDYEYSISYFGIYGIKEMFPKSIYDEYIELTFGDSKFYAIKEYDNYLTQIYGDYMTPPPPEKRITHHNFKIYKK